MSSPAMAVSCRAGLVPVTTKSARRNRGGGSTTRRSHTNKVFASVSAESVNEGDEYSVDTLIRQPPLSSASTSASARRFFFPESVRRAASSAASIAAAIVLSTATLSDPSFASNRDVPNKHSPIANLPEVLTEPDVIFSEDFNVTFAGVTVDHKYLITALVLGQSVGFIGSMVGGNEARVRREETERLNAALVKVNAAMRDQMRASKVGVYTPVDVEASPSASTDEDRAEVSAVVEKLRVGKSQLKSGNNKDALVSFGESVKLIAQFRSALNEPWKAERKAHRGLGAAYERLGNHEAALDEALEVLRLSAEHDDGAGMSDAMGLVADIYTEMNDLEKAALWYDKYLVSLDNEGTERMKKSKGNGEGQHAVI